MFGVNAQDRIPSKNYSSPSPKIVPCFCTCTWGKQQVAIFTFKCSNLCSTGHLLWRPLPQYPGMAFWGEDGSSALGLLNGPRTPMGALFRPFKPQPLIPGFINICTSRNWKGNTFKGHIVSVSPPQKRGGQAKMRILAGFIAQSKGTLIFQKQSKCIGETSAYNSIFPHLTAAQWPSKSKVF